VVDTPGYGDSINTTDCYKSILNYIDNQFERYLNDESGLNRRNISDNRVHCLFYFISPFTRGFVFFFLKRIFSYFFLFLDSNHWILNV
jgi:septin 2